MPQTKPIVFYDVETTGLSPQHDYIIQLSAVKFDPETWGELGRWNNYIKPSRAYTIHPDAEVTHGLSKDFIEKNGKLLKDVGPSFIEFIKDCDLAGYNSNSFDVKFLYNDFALAGFEFPIEDVQFFDVMRMQQRLYPNKLSEVYKRYFGKTMEEAGLKAHDSMSDVIATGRVMQAQMDKHNLGWDEIRSWQENQLLTPDGTVRNAARHDEPMLLVFSQGKYKDVDVYKVMNEDVSYLKWASQNLFSPYTLKLVRKYCKTRKESKK